MSWRYAVTREHFENPDDPAGDDAYTIREVYFDRDDKVIGWTPEAASPFGDTSGELHDDLTKMLAAFDKPFLDLPVKAETTPEEQ